MSFACIAVQQDSTCTSSHVGVRKEFSCRNRPIARSSMCTRKDVYQLRNFVLISFNANIFVISNLNITHYLPSFTRIICRTFPP